MYHKPTIGLDSKPFVNDSRSRGAHLAQGKQAVPPARWRLCTALRIALRSNLRFSRT